MVEHDEAVDQPHHRLHRVLDDRDRHARRGELPDHRDDLVDFVMPSPARVSSSSRRRGCPARARASSISRSCMVVSSPAMRSAMSDSPTRSSASLASAAPRHRSWRGHRRPTTTFSETDMRGNGRTTWKVRPTPAWQSWCGLRPTMSRPSSSTRRSGRRKPFSRLNSVVLPAPFGPIMPRIRRAA